MYKLVPGITSKLNQYFLNTYGESSQPLKILRDNLQLLPEISRQYLVYNPLLYIPRFIIQEIEKDFQDILYSYRHTIAGSYRRKLPYSRDIDLVIIGDSTSVIDQINTSSKYQVVMPAYSSGPEKVSFMMKLVYLSTSSYECYVKLDLFITDKKHYAYMLFYATGSQSFNIRMRIKSRKKGYLLNQRGLYQDNAWMPAETEQDIFQLLGISYIEPQDREK